MWLVLLPYQNTETRAVYHNALELCLNHLSRKYVKNKPSPFIVINTGTLMTISTRLVMHLTISFCSVRFSVLDLYPHVSVVPNDAFPTPGFLPLTFRLESLAAVNLSIDCQAWIYTIEILGGHFGKQSRELSTFCVSCEYLFISDSG